MIFGMTPFTFVHVLLSLIGIVTGFVMLYGLLHANPLPRWTARPARRTGARRS